MAWLLCRRCTSGFQRAKILKAIAEIPHQDREDVTGKVLPLCKIVEDGETIEKILYALKKTPGKDRAKLVARIMRHISERK